MTILDNDSIKNIHCIGIGGIGVSGIAEILLRKGYCVTGSDLHKTEITTRLRSLGLRVYLKHQAENIQGADLIVYSSAISNDNPEMVAARLAEIPLISRGQLLAELIQPYFNIVVSGTNGKTTTTGLIARIFDVANRDPNYLIGGYIRGQKATVRYGQSQYFIAEADESDASFLFMRPKVAVVTNIQPDHLENYGGDFQQLQRSFVDFIKKISNKNGFAMIGADCPFLQKLLPEMRAGARVKTFGFSTVADYQALDYQVCGLGSTFLVHCGVDRLPLKVSLNIPGRYNVLNALAAIGVAHEVGISDTALISALKSFPGMQRRFHPHGRISLTKGEALLFEDYGHHPSAIAATLETARQIWPHQRIVLVFQPHRYSRTRDLMNDFVDVLCKADVLVLMDIYAASETPVEEGSAKKLFEALEAVGNRFAVFVPEMDQVPTSVKALLCPNDIVILQGAGTVGQLASKLCQ